jgi:hypothetical protein
VLYLTRGLLNVLQHYTWDTSSVARAQVYLRALDMLAASAQEVYPYHVKKGEQLHVEQLKTVICTKTQ